MEGTGVAPLPVSQGQVSVGRSGTPVNVVREKSVPRSTGAVIAATSAITSGSAANLRLQVSCPPLSIPQLAVVTPVVSSRLYLFLRGYDSAARDFLYQGFTFGFRLHSDRDFSHLSHTIPSNHGSAKQNPSVVREKLSAELSSDRIAGPYNSPPLPNMIFSPLGLVPKREPGRFRLIHDLSFPKGSSVNESIPPDLATVHYQSLDKCVSIIQGLGKGTLVAKADLKDAFRIVPVHPSDHHLLGFTWEGLFYYDKCLPMGCRLSCSLFEALSNALQWILMDKLSVPHMSHILDDFIFFGPPSDLTSWRSLQTFLVMAESLHLPIKHDKTVHPTTTVQLHGVEVDTLAMQLRLPRDKLLDARTRVTNMSRRKKVQLRGLQSLLGVLVFACKVVVPGRVFLRRLYNLTIGVTGPKHWISLNNQARADLAMWRQFLDGFNGRAILLPDSWTSSETLMLRTDASGQACAAVLGDRWFQVIFPPSWVQNDITTKELLPIVLAVRMWGESWANSRISFLCDNQAVVQIINAQTAKPEPLLGLLRHLVLFCLQFNIHFCAKHIPGKSNIVPDCISRFQLDKARRFQPSLHPDPELCPQELLPW